MKFELLSKDRIIAVVNISTTQYEQNCSFVSIFDRHLLPISIQTGYEKLQQWIEGRHILEYRVKQRNFFEALGIKSLEEFISVTHGVSLNDCFWLKEENSRITWNQVSPYKNSFNENISMYSFSGNYISRDSIGSSPDFSLDGNFPKCWRRENNEIVLVKAGTSGAYNAGYEPYSEVFACQLADWLNIPIIHHRLGTHRGIEVSKSKCICNENLGIAKIREIHNRASADFEWLLNQYDSRYIQVMLMFDYFICNVDRHFGNIWRYVETDNNKVADFTPFADHNLSCIPYYVSGETKLESYIDDIRAKDGRTWEQLIQLVDKRVVKNAVQKINGFKFRKLGNKRADSRVEILNSMLKYQIKKLK